MSSAKMPLLGLTRDILTNGLNSVGRKPESAAKRSRQPPAPIDEVALHGIVGDFVRLLMPHTESGLPAVLLQFLVASGLYIGRTGYYQVEGDRHYPNLFVAIVGSTSKGRKGTSWGQILRLFRRVDEQFVSKCITSGLSSGEGLIWAVRDEIWEPVKKSGPGPVEYQHAINSWRICSAGQSHC